MIDCVVYKPLFMISAQVTNHTPLALVDTHVHVYIPTFEGSHLIHTYVRIFKSLGTQVHFC